MRIAKMDRKRFCRLLLLSFVVSVVGLFSGLSAEETPKPEKKHAIPAGAAAAGYVKCLFDVKPTVADISPDQKGVFAWYSGQWYSEAPPMSKYSMTNGVLTLEQGGDLTSYPPDFSHPGKLSTLSGRTGFYVEFEVSLSSNDPDHFPAVWLMPIEKNGKKEDIYPGSPDQFERWMELDVDEGGFGPGTTSTVHNCWGIYPDYHHLQNGNNVSKASLDRTQKHRFGASYDPKTATVCWWLDDRLIASATAPYVPTIAVKQNFYLIMGAQTHKEKKPYQMFVYSVRAYVPFEEE